MARSTTFRYQLPSGETQEITLGDFLSIEIHFRFPDNEKLVVINRFGGSDLVPIETAKEFLHWFAEI